MKNRNIDLQPLRPAGLQLFREAFGVRTRPRVAFAVPQHVRTTRHSEIVPPFGPSPKSDAKTHRTPKALRAKSVEDASLRFSNTSASRLARRGGYRSATPPLRPLGQSHSYS